mmetsp:Transcript_14581/g.34586  ORF Transcript_14581/g.34586 Transcript_14581/m.34586 type:complete len:202 (-) Transcript_14581:133-738(-)
MSEASAIGSWESMPQLLWSSRRGREGRRKATKSMMRYRFLPPNPSPLLIYASPMPFLVLTYAPPTPSSVLRNAPPTPSSVEHGELVACLEAMGDGADAVVAADVMCYISDLSPAFEAVAGALRRREGGAGLLAFSTESLESGKERSKGWGLKSSGRYGHEATWVRSAVEGAGMTVVEEEEEVLRMNGEEEVWGRVWVASLP